MEGGAGDDTYVVNIVGDVILENTLAGSDTVISSISYNLGVNLENLQLIGGGSFGTQEISPECYDPLLAEAVKLCCRFVIEMDCYDFLRV
jgi:Ca2+-binding RTX toxin-like protein